MSFYVKRINLFCIIICALITIFAENYAIAENNVITVYYNKEIGQVNKKVFGNNFVGYDTAPHNPGIPHYYGYADYGSGVWNPTRNESVKEVITLAKEAGLSVIRFPGGCGTHHYDWKESIGKDRKHFFYGVDEFLKTVNEIGAEAVITISYFTGTEQDAADLVEYLNTPCDGKHPWADKRAENGYPDPYGVKYFEIGNEVWHGNHKDIKDVLPEEYTSRYLRYYEAMKAVDPLVQIGVVLQTPNWNKRVLEIIKAKLDFGIIHTYPNPNVWGKELKRMLPDEVFSITLAVPILTDEPGFQATLKLLKEYSARDIPLAITEYNGFFLQDKPVPYRHSLGTALINAELLRIFMKPEYKIIMANYWQFSNGYWGMIKSENDFMLHKYEKPINYIKRPNYYVYELYNKHFGDILIDIEVKSGTYDIKDIEVYRPYMREFILKMGEGTTTEENLFLDTSIPYLSVNASKNKNGDKIYLMVINKNMNEAINSLVGLKDFLPFEKANAWILNGPSVDATNEEKADNVRISHREFEIENVFFEFTFEPHSMTAIEIRRRE